MSDNNYPPGNFCDQDGLMIDGLVLSPPDQGAGFDDIFKLSRVTGSKFYNGPSVKFQYCLSFVSFLYVLVKTILHPKSLP